MKKYIAEFIGTFALVFFGTGAIVVNDLSNGAIGHLGIAIAFGLVVMIMIFAFGSLSGAHLNPAVSIAFSITDIFSLKSLVPYILAQLTGALLASALLHILFYEHQTLGMTVPSGSYEQSFILESILTYFLMLVILMVSQSKDISKFSAIAIGGTVLLEALFAGPICGASMNPARSIAPALFAGDFQALWIYIAAPILGAILASGTWVYLKK